MDDKLSNLEVRVHGLEGQVTDLGHRFGGMENKIDKLIDAMANNSKTNWPVLASLISAGVVLLGLMGTWSLQPIRTSIEDLKSNEVRIQSDLVPRAEHRDRWQAIKEDNNDTTSRMLRGFDVMNHRLEKVEDHLLLEAGKSKRR